MGSKGIFLGSANPLSGKAILNACVVPTCLSGCENWILNDVLLSTLEAFQGYVGCRILKLSKFHSHLIPLMVLGIPSMRARILTAKLCFLSRITSPENNSLSSQTFRKLQEDGVETALVQQCRFLQEPYDSDFASRILQAQGCTDELSSCKKEILKADASLVRARAADHPSLKFLLRLNLSWLTVWDDVLDQGPHATHHATRTLFTITKPSLSENVCNICDSLITNSFLEHVLSAHLEEDSVDSLLDQLSSSNAIIQVRLRLSKLF